MITLSPQFQCYKIIISVISAFLPFCTYHALLETYAVEIWTFLPPVKFGSRLVSCNVTVFTYYNWLTRRRSKMQHICHIVDEESGRCSLAVYFRQDSLIPIACCYEDTREGTKNNCTAHFPSRSFKMCRSTYDKVYARKGHANGNYVPYCLFSIYPFFFFLLKLYFLITIVNISSVLFVVFYM